MALTESNMLPLGTTAPPFALPDTVSGKTLQLADVQGTAATVVMFLCNHCPYVIYVNAQIVQIAADYADKNVGFVAISSNDAVKYPQDAPELMTTHAQKVGYTFPYLYDESQAVARAYDAACTPDFYVFDGNQQLAYRGQLCASRPNSGTPVTGSDLRAALAAVLAHQKPSDMQRPSAGCGIKWK